MASPHNGFEQHGVTLTSQGRVAWSTDSKDHPRNWSVWSKSYTAIVVIWLETYMTAISIAGTATAREASNEYGTSMIIGILCFITTYMIGQAMGGILLAPIADMFGRRTVYIVSTLVFGIAAVITGIPRHLAAATIGRFIQGVAASIPATVAFGNFNDMYDPDTRAWVVYWYTLGGMGGLALGPIYSSYVTDLHGWRWVYYIAAIVSAASTIAACFIRESNADQLLQAKTTELRKLSGDTTLIAESDRTSSSIKGARTSTTTSTNGVTSVTTTTTTTAAPTTDNNTTKPITSTQPLKQTRLLPPLHLLLTEPLILLPAALSSLAFSLPYALTLILPRIYTLPPFTPTFNTPRKLTLTFLALLPGLLLTILPRLLMHHTLARHRRLRRRTTPECKTHSLLVSCPLFALGLWLLAWTVPPRVTAVPWPLSLLGLVCVGFAIVDITYVLRGYVADAYAPEQAAGAVGAVALARALAAAAFPLFVSPMYGGLGNNVATTLVAVAATLGCVVPWVLVQKGEALRAASPWAASGEKSLWDENRHMREGGSGEVGGVEGHGLGQEMTQVGGNMGADADGDDDTTCLSPPESKTHSNVGTRGSSRLTMRSPDLLGRKHKRTWSEVKGSVEWTYTKVRL